VQVPAAEAKVGSVISESDSIPVVASILVVERTVIELVAWLPLVGEYLRLVVIASASKIPPSAQVVAVIAFLKTHSYDS